MKFAKLIKLTSATLIAAAAATGVTATPANAAKGPSTGGLVVVPDACTNPTFGGVCIDRDVALGLAGDDLLMAWAVCDTDAGPLEDCIELTIAENPAEPLNVRHFRLYEDACTGPLNSGCYNDHRYGLRVDVEGTLNVSSRPLFSQLVQDSTYYVTSPKAFGSGYYARRSGTSSLIVTGSASYLDWDLEFRDRFGNLEFSEGEGWISANGNSTPLSRCLQGSQNIRDIIGGVGTFAEGLYRMTTTAGRVLTPSVSLGAEFGGVKVSGKPVGTMSKDDTNQMVLGATQVFGTLADLQHGFNDAICRWEHGTESEQDVPNDLTPADVEGPGGGDGEGLECKGGRVECVGADGSISDSGATYDPEAEEYFIVVSTEECADGGSLQFVCESIWYTAGASVLGDDE